MAIRIGHASIGENGIRGNKAGDSTGKEVCIRNWYNKPWAYVLRCKDSIKADRMAKACEDGCNNNNIGYNQDRRNTLNTEAQAVLFDLSKITRKCETDCSAFMTVCAQAAGIAVPYNKGNAPTTSTMKQAFTSTGMFDVLTDSYYLASPDHLKRGDILVKPGSHTVMVLDTAQGTGYPTLREGNTSTYVRILQQRLNFAGADLKIDGEFGPLTKQAVISFQGMHKIRKDGIVGPQTWDKLLM